MWVIAYLSRNSEIHSPWRFSDYNPNVFDNPEEFRPSRWYGKRDAEMIGFGVGSRACLGRKFALTEAICLITLILRDWKIEPVLEEGETFTSWRARVLQSRVVGLTFGVKSVPLKFTRRF